MAAVAETAPFEGIFQPRIPVRGFLRYGRSGAIQMSREESPSESDPEESRAIEAARLGDPEAFDILVRRYSRRVLSIVWNVVRDAALAEDIAQDAFVKAWKTMGRFRSGERFGPWIYRIATNLAIDALRKRSRRSEQPVDGELVSRLTPGQCELSGTAGRIDEALDSLPEMQRIVARLHLVEELSHREIAGMTGLAEGTVRSHLSLARKKLQESLSDIYGG